MYATSPLSALSGIPICTRSWRSFVSAFKQPSKEKVQKCAIWLIILAVRLLIASESAAVLIIGDNNPNLEALHLEAQITRLYEDFPSTLWPIAHLHRRLARLLTLESHTIPTIATLDNAIENYQQATTTFSEWNQCAHHPIHAAMMLELLRCHVYMLQSLLRDAELVEIPSGPGVPDRLMMSTLWEESLEIEDRLAIAEGIKAETTEEIDALFGTVGGPLTVRLAQTVESLEQVVSDIRGLL